MKESHLICNRKSKRETYTNSMNGMMRKLGTLSIESVRQRILSLISYGAQACGRALMSRHVTSNSRHSQVAIAEWRRKMSMSDDCDVVISSSLSLSSSLIHHWRDKRGTCSAMTPALSLGNMISFHSDTLVDSCC